MVDDLELLRSYAAEKSSPAFAALVARHLDLVYSAALRRVNGDAHAAADVTQQVFVSLARQAATLARGVVLPAWLYATTRNVAVDFVRAEQRRRIREKEAHMRHEQNERSSATDEWERLRPLLDGAMDELSGGERDAVLLRFFARQPFAEIGRALHVSEDAARMRVDRALEKLRVLLGRRGVTSTGAALGFALESHAVVVAPAGLQASVHAAVALVTPTATASAGAGFLQLMSNTKLVIGLAGALAALTLGVVWHERSARRAAELALAAAESAQRTRAAARLEEERETLAAEAEQARLAQEVEMARAAQKAAAGKTAAPAAANPAADWNPLEEGRAFLAKHPETKAALIAWRRAELEARYGKLWRALGLTEGQMEECRTLLLTANIATRQFAGSMKYPMALPAGDRLGVGPPNERLREIMGEAGYRQFEELDRGFPARLLASRLAEALAFTDAPLTPTQADDFVRVAVAAQAPGKGRAPGKVDLDKLVSNAPAVLSAPQVAVLSELRTRDQASDAVNAARQSDAAPRQPTK